MLSLQLAPVFGTRGEYKQNVYSGATTNNCQDYKMSENEKFHNPSVVGPTVQNQFIQFTVT